MNTLAKFAYTFSISKIVKDDRGKKTPIGMPMWSKFKNPSECTINKNDKVLCVITGLKNNISVIDCDTTEGRGFRTGEGSQVCNLGV